MAHDIFCDFLTTTEMDVFSLKVTKDGHRISRVVIGGKAEEFCQLFCYILYQLQAGDRAGPRYLAIMRNGFLLTKIYLFKGFPFHIECSCVSFQEKRSYGSLWQGTNCLQTVTGDPF